jgi:hypothetical protein
MGRSLSQHLVQNLNDLVDLFHGVVMDQTDPHYPIFCIDAQAIHEPVCVEMAVPYPDLFGARQKKKKSVCVRGTSTI